MSGRGNEHRIYSCSGLRLTKLNKSNVLKSCSKESSLQFGIVIEIIFAVLSQNKFRKRVHGQKNGLGNEERLFMAHQQIWCTNK